MEYLNSLFDMQLQKKHLFKGLNKYLFIKSSIKKKKKVVKKI